MNKNKLSLISIIKGGIGNQLFQIAFGLRLSRKHNLGITFDVGSYTSYTYKHVSILERIFNELPIFSQSLIETSSIRVFNEEVMDQFKHWIEGNQIDFGAETTHILLNGYWQDNSLIEDKDARFIRDRLIASLTPSQKKLAHEISSTKNSTSVHFRRHDYKHHGIVNENYYLQTINWLKNIKGPLEIMVFSDEPNYVAYLLQNIGIDATLINSGDDVADLALMMHCENHIIANSSYSWWGAKLSKQSTVIAPLDWSFMGPVSKSLCPESWIRVPNVLERAITNIPDLQNTLDNELRRSREHTLIIE